MPFAKADKIPQRHGLGEAELVAQIKFANWTGDRKLRAPVYLGLRDDKTSAEVSREEAPAARVSSARQERSDHRDRWTQPQVHQSRQALLPRRRLHEARSAELLRCGRASAAAASQGSPAFAQTLSERHSRSSISSRRTRPPAIPPGCAPRRSDKIRYVLAEDRASLLYLTNLGCIDQNPWMSRVGSLDHPDYILIDLDPQECAYDEDRGSGAAGQGRNWMPSASPVIPKPPAATACNLHSDRTAITPTNRRALSRK